MCSYEYLCLNAVLGYNNEYTNSPNARALNSSSSIAAVRFIVLFDAFGERYYDKAVK
jgi:hypothetical protein